MYLKFTFMLTTATRRVRWDESGRKKITKYVFPFTIYILRTSKKFMILEAIVHVLVVYVKCEFFMLSRSYYGFSQTFKYIKLDYFHTQALLFDDDVQKFFQLFSLCVWWNVTHCMLLI